MDNIVYSTGLGGELNLLEPVKKKEDVDDWQFVEPMSHSDYEYEMDDEASIEMEKDEGLIEDSMMASLNN